MMTPKEILNKVGEVLKAAFSEQAPPPVTPAEPVKMMVDVPLKDGTIVKVDKLEVGGMVTLNDAPAPDAVHLTEDGRKVTTVGGVITEIGTEEVEPMPEEMKALPAKVGEMKAQFAAVENTYKAKFEAQELKFATQEKKIEALKKGFDEMLEQVIVMSEMSVKPSKEKPVEPTTENYKKVLKARGKI